MSLEKRNQDPSTLRPKRFSPPGPPLALGHRPMGLGGGTAQPREGGTAPSPARHGADQPFAPQQHSPQGSPAAPSPLLTPGFAAAACPAGTRLSSGFAPPGRAARLRAPGLPGEGGGTGAPQEAFIFPPLPCPPCPRQGQLLPPRGSPPRSSPWPRRMLPLPELRLSSPPRVLCPAYLPRGRKGIRAAELRAPGQGGGPVAGVTVGKGKLGPRNKDRRLECVSWAGTSTSLSPASCKSPIGSPGLKWRIELHQGRCFCPLVVVVILKCVLESSFKFCSWF